MTTFAFELREYPLPGGPVQYAPIPWDAEAFGFPVYELQVSDGFAATPDDIRGWLRHIESTAGGLVCAKVPQQMVPLLRTLSGMGFYPVETALDLSLVLAAAVHHAAPGRVPTLLRRAEQADVAAIRDIAARAFWSDRFHLDPNIADSAADERYARWVERAFEGGELLYAFERTDDGSIVGFYHLRAVTETTVDHLLVAMDPRLAGTGLGTALYAAAVQESIRLGFTQAQTRVVAQNLPAMNILARLGFSLRGARTVMHWYSPGSAA